MDRYTRFIEIMEELIRKDPDRIDWQNDLSVGLSNAGNICRNLSENDKALEYFTRCVEIRENLVKKDPDRTEWQRDLGVSLNNVGSLYENLGELEKALGYYKRVLEIRRTLVDKEPGVVDRCVGLAFALLDMARITQNDDQKREFEMEAQSITRSLLQSGAKHRGLNVLRSFFSS